MAQSTSQICCDVVQSPFRSECAAWIGKKAEGADTLLKDFVDVRGLERLTPCLQSRLGKTLNAFAGVAYTENWQNSRSLIVPKLYRVLLTGPLLAEPRVNVVKSRRPYSQQTSSVETKDMSQSRNQSVRPMPAMISRKRGYLYVHRL
jgi:hypothetical protein